MKNRTIPTLNNTESKTPACVRYEELLANPPTASLTDCRSAFQRGETHNYYEFFQRQPCRTVTVIDKTKIDAARYACMQGSKP